MKLLPNAVGLRVKHDPMSAARDIDAKIIRKLPRGAPAPPPKPPTPLPEPTPQLRACAAPVVAFDRGRRKYIDGVPVQYNGKRSGGRGARLYNRKRPNATI